MSVVFVGLVLRYDHDLRGAIHEKMIRRDAAVLTSVAQQEIESADLTPDRTNSGRWLAALLPAAHREGLLAMAIFDADGVVLEKIPAGQLLVEIPPDDFVSLQDGRPITRFWRRACPHPSRSDSSVTTSMAGAWRPSWPNSTQGCAGRRR